MTYRIAAFQSSSVTLVHSRLLSVTHNMASLAMLFRFHFMSFLRDRRGRLTLESHHTANRVGRWSSEGYRKMWLQMFYAFRNFWGLDLIKTPAVLLHSVHNFSSFVSRYWVSLLIYCWSLLIISSSSWIQTCFGWVLMLVTLKSVVMLIFILKKTVVIPYWTFYSFIYLFIYFTRQQSIFSIFGSFGWRQNGK